MYYAFRLLIIFLLATSKQQRGRGRKARQARAVGDAVATTATTIPTAVPAITTAAVAPTTTATVASTTTPPLTCTAAATPAAATATTPAATNAFAPTATNAVALIATNAIAPSATNTAAPSATNAIAPTVAVAPIAPTAITAVTTIMTATISTTNLVDDEGENPFLDLPTYNQPSRGLDDEDSTGWTSSGSELGAPVLNRKEA